MKVYKLRRKSDGFFYNKNNGWVKDSDLGEPYRTKAFASNACKRLFKMFRADHFYISKEDAEIVEYDLTELCAHAF